MKTDCDFLYDWIKKNGHIRKILPKMVNPRDIAGNAKEMVAAPATGFEHCVVDSAAAGKAANCYNFAVICCGQPLYAMVLRSVVGVGRGLLQSPKEKNVSPQRRKTVLIEQTEVGCRKGVSCFV